MMFFSAVVSSQNQLITTEYTTYGGLIHSIEEVIKSDLEPSEVLRAQFSELRKSHDLLNSEQIYQDFIRIRTIFEATRDSGLWNIRWTITDREPNSDEIWNQWKDITTSNHFDEMNLVATASAECDELSALFALIVRDLGVKEVGLFWPTANHTVAVWITKDKAGKPLRIVVPTSQIFVSDKATLGTKEFDPYQQKTIYQYRRRDVDKGYKIPAELADMMIQQIKQYGGRSSAFLQNRRNELSRKIGGS